MNYTQFKVREILGRRAGFWSLLAIFLWHSPSAQTLSPILISPYAGSAQVGAISLDWSTGEIAISTVKTSTTLFTEGFNQPFLTITPQLPSEETETEILKRTIRVFPNPAHNSFMVRLDQENDLGSSVEIIDLQGRLIHTQIIESGASEAEILLMGYPSGLYLVRVTTSSGKHQLIYKLSKI